MSIHEALKQAVDEEIRRQPERLTVYYEYMMALQSGGFAQSWIDVIMQSPRGEIGLYDAAMFAWCWWHIQVGLICHAPIGPIREPRGDKYNHENNESLSHLLAPFHGYFEGGAGDDDGYLEWDTNIQLAKGNNAELVDVSAGSAPLEAGYTEATTTVWHLIHERRVARWPYESSIIWVLVRADPGSSLQLPLFIRDEPC